MDILLQYLNIRRQKQEFVKITDVPCSSLCQSTSWPAKIYMIDRAVSFIDYLEQNFRSNYLLTGVLDAEYCARKELVEFSYVDFRQLTCGPGEASGTD